MKKKKNNSMNKELSQFYTPYKKIHKGIKIRAKVLLLHDTSARLKVRSKTSLIASNNLHIIEQKKAASEGQLT